VPGDPEGNRVETLHGAQACNERPIAPARPAQRKQELVELVHRGAPTAPEGCDQLVLGQAARAITRNVLRGGIGRDFGRLAGLEPSGGARGLPAFAIGLTEMIYAAP
jgi:hypothetical protein